MSDRNASKISVAYENGESKEIKRGVAAEFVGDTMKMDMVDITKFDLVRLTYGMLSTLEQMGLTDLLMAYTSGSSLLDED
jgi:hypothetical protein